MEERRQLSEITDTLRTFIGVLEKRKWFAIAVLVATVGVSMLLASKQSPVYKATATIIIEKRSPTVLSRVQEVIELGTSDYWSMKEYMQTQLEILKSRRLAKRVVDKLTLALDERFLGLDGNNPPLSEAEKRRRMAKMDAVAVLMGRVEVEARMDSQLVLVSVEAPDPHMAQDLANALVTEYRQENLEYKKRVVSDAISELRDMLLRLKQEKEEAEAKVLEFERRHAMGSLESRKRSVEEKLKTYDERYLQAGIDRSDLESSPLRDQLDVQIAALEVLLKEKDFSRVAHPLLVESSTISLLKQKLVDLETKVRELTGRYGPKHPMMKAAYSQRKLVRNTLQREASMLLQAELIKLRKQHAEESDKLVKSIQMEDELRKMLERAKEEETALVKLELDYEPLRKNEEEVEKHYESVKERYSETSLSAQVETNNVRIQDLAPLPDLPIRPNRKLSLLIGVFLGLLLGIGAAFFVESLDSTLKTREDIEVIMGVDFLGLLPAIGEMDRPEVDGPHEQPELFVHHFPKSSITEHFRTVKTNLFFSRPGERLRHVLIASPGPKEGKTTVAVNLAAVNAAAGSRTLIVDTDMRRPRVHKLLGIPRRPGITEFYLGTAPIENFTRSTTVEGMDVLTCGSISPNPVEILESAKFRQMLERLTELYDTVFFDSPPLLAVADAKIICSMLDSGVLVVKAGQTTKDALKEARRMLYPIISEDVGVVLNCFDVEKHSYRYYYYRSKRYGYYNYYAYDDKGAGEPESTIDISPKERRRKWAKQ